MTLSITSSIAVGTFATVILAIASNRIHLTVAAMLGTVLLLVTGVLSARDVSETINPAEAMIALFFGGMVMARTLIATGLFDYLGAIGLRLVRGDGRRLLIAIAGLAAPICAFLPNATVVILIGPLIVAVCERMKIDFVPPLILLVFVANSSGLLTLVGDPATFIVGNSIGLSFTQYLRLLSPGGVLAIVAVLALLPISFRPIWRVRLPETGVIADLGSFLGTFFGNDVVLASLFLLTGIGVLSSVIPNVALVVAMLPLVKQYVVGAGLVAPAALEAGYGQIPSSVLPLFFAMCFGATLGGNATLLGAGSNIIAGGICARAGRQISFLTFLRYGIPVTAVQLFVSAIYIWLRFL